MKQVQALVRRSLGIFLAAMIVSTVYPGSAYAGPLEFVERTLASAFARLGYSWATNDVKDTKNKQQAISKPANPCWLAQSGQVASKCHAEAPVASPVVDQLHKYRDSAPKKN